MVGLEVIKSPPQGAGGGQRAIASGGRGWGLGFWRSGDTRPQSILSPPPGAGGGQRAQRAGGGGGEGVDGMHMAQNESGRPAPPFCEVRAKRRQRGGR